MQAVECSPNLFSYFHELVRNHNMFPPQMIPIFTRKMQDSCVEKVNTPQVALGAQGDGLDGGLVTGEAVKHLARFDVPDLI